MFIIKSEQIKVFQPDAEEAFVERVMDYLLENHADAPVRLPNEQTIVERLPEKTLREMVREGIERGRLYGIEWQSSLISYVVLMFLTAPNFDEHPEVADYLMDEEIETDRRIDVMMDELPNKIWEEVKEIYDPRIWNLNIEPETV